MAVKGESEAKLNHLLISPVCRMILYLECQDNPLTKQDLSDPNSLEPSKWVNIIETIGAWFCFSNGLRKNRDIIIKTDKFIYKFIGNELRYLGPSFRSIGSLLANANLTALKHSSNIFKEATPGIYVKPRVPSDLDQAEYEIQHRSVDLIWDTLKTLTSISFSNGLMDQMSQIIIVMNYVISWTENTA